MKPLSLLVHSAYRPQVSHRITTATTLTDVSPNLRILHSWFSGGMSHVSPMDVPISVACYFC